MIFRLIIHYINVYINKNSNKVIMYFPLFSHLQ